MEDTKKTKPTKEIEWFHITNSENWGNLTGPTLVCNRSDPIDESKSRDIFLPLRQKLYPTYTNLQMKLFSFIQGSLTGETKDS